MGKNTLGIRMGYPRPFIATSGPDVAPAVEAIFDIKVAMAVGNKTGSRYNFITP